MGMAWVEIAGIYRGLRIDVCGPFSACQLCARFQDGLLAVLIAAGRPCARGFGPTSWLARLLLGGSVDRAASLPMWLGRSHAHIHYGQALFAGLTLLEMGHSRFHQRPNSKRSAPRVADGQAHRQVGLDASCSKEHLASRRQRQACTAQGV